MRIATFRMVLTRFFALLCLLLAGTATNAQMQAGRGHDDLQPLRLAIDQRLLLAQAVARAKWNVQAPVEDLQREAQVIQAAVKQGATLGLPDRWVETVFRAQIEASKIVQRELFAQWTAQHAGKFDDAPDLARTVRPELDRITTQILRSLADNQAALTNPARQAEVAGAMLPLEAATVSPGAAERALLPFIRPQ
jgi:cyclohexadienyl dehydratase